MPDNGDGTPRIVYKEHPMAEEKTKIQKPIRDTAKAKSHKKDGSYQLNRRVKKILNDIIDTAYSDCDEETLKQFKHFRLYISNIEKASSSGQYFPSESRIEVYNPSLGARHMAKCCIHELAHHIDKTKNGTTGHQKPFYEEYRKLMYASLDLGILDRDDFIDNWSSDRNKVRKMLEKYQPCPVDYQLPGGLILQCRNCYKIRDELKKRDFTWNNMEEAWEKTIKKEDKDAFLEMLKDLGCKDVEIRNEWDMHIDASIVVTANGNTYDAKEALKKRGFWFDSESKTWKRKLRSKDVGLFLETIRMADEFKNVTFTI